MFRKRFHAERNCEWKKAVKCNTLEDCPRYIIAIKNNYINNKYLIAAK